MSSRARRVARIGVYCCLFVLTSGSPLAAGDWPMWRYDAGHTGASADDLPEKLQLEWTRQYSRRTPVWDDPLNHDLMPYDRVFEPVVFGRTMFVGFNDADKVVAINVDNGEELWTFYADGPVRFSPVAALGNVYFASDDGHLYCLDARHGKLKWKFLGGPTQRKVIGNKRVISAWPARGGPVLDDETVYFAASIWPFMGTFIYALDAQTGKPKWTNDATGAEFIKQPHNALSFAGVAPQGQLVVSGDKLLIPGGRSVPAVLDRRTGEVVYFNYTSKGEGGSSVVADQSRFFVHTRVRGTVAYKLSDGSKTNIRANDPVLADDFFYTANSPGEAAGQPVPAVIQAFDSQNQLAWQVVADGSGDLIKAGSRLYAAGPDAIVAVDTPSGGENANIAWSISVEGQVLRLLAAADRLFAVTLDGRIMAFGAKQDEAKTLAPAMMPVEPSAKASQRAAQLLDLAGTRQGYALWFGVDDVQLLEAVVADSELHVVGVDPNAQLIDRLRRRLDKAGLYGNRVALHRGDPATFRAPPYMAQLIVIGESAASKLNDAVLLRRVYESVRPYGGKLWIPTGQDKVAGQLKRFRKANLPKARLNAAADGILVVREGALPGSADWTHAYGDVANTVKSDDQLVKLPLGVLWFGGNSNMDVLPRHSHGPSQQVVGGRLFIEGINSLSARDVYTGRVLWKREFEDLGTFQVYYDESYADTPLATNYNQVHIPGANSRGTNYVATDEGVYLVLGSSCQLLDPQTGRTIRRFDLPATEGRQTPSWGFIGVYKNLLLAGVGFGNYSDRLGYVFTPSRRKGPAWGPDQSGSLALAAFDRDSGELLWKVDANQSFLHNAIVAGGGRIYCLDKLPKRVQKQNKRRGEADQPADQPADRLLALDAQTGQPVWSTNENVFGTWLSYSEKHDILLQAGAAASDRSLDEVGTGMTTYRGTDGSVIWDKPDFSYVGPCILHNDTVITNSTSYRESQGAFGLLDGLPVTIDNPLTGKPQPWRFTRTYGCNTAVAAEHILTFRSGAAGFYDLDTHAGTGNFGGFKSSCSSSLIVANGVLNAPDYTRTCTCAYQNQTSLALVHMPENDLWTYNLFDGPTQPEDRIRNLGINLGAPGDRRSEEGTLWIDYPSVGGSSPEISVALEGTPNWFRRHSSRVSGPAPAWIGASGAEGVRSLTLQIVPEEQPDKGSPAADKDDDPQEQPGNAVATRPYSVRIHCIEPNADVQPGQRVFDIAIQGKTVLRGLDVVKQAGGPNRQIVRRFNGIPIGKELNVTLTPATQLEPVLCGIEVVEE